MSFRMKYHKLMKILSRGLLPAAYFQPGCIQAEKMWVGMTRDFKTPYTFFDRYDQFSFLKPVDLTDGVYLVSGMNQGDPKKSVWRLIDLDEEYLLLEEVSYEEARAEAFQK